MGNVLISPNIKRERVRIDPQGNVINPKTKEIIEKKEEEYIEPSPQPQNSPITKENTKVADMSIQEQIEQAKANLKKLEELKKVKIEEMERELKQLKEQ